MIELFTEIKEDAYSEAFNFMMWFIWQEESVGLMSRYEEDLARNPDHKWYKISSKCKENPRFSAFLHLKKKK